ncbi:MAG: hypothetical protein ACRDPW_06280 [Mycobacteriales bacterium]
MISLTVHLEVALAACRQAAGIPADRVRIVARRVGESTERETQWPNLGVREVATERDGYGSPPRWGLCS